MKHDETRGQSIARECQGSYRKQQPFELLSRGVLIEQDGIGRTIWFMDVYMQTIGCLHRSGSFFAKIGDIGADTFKQRY